MSREWKPGDVAMAAYPNWDTDDYTERAIVRGLNCWVRLDDTDDFVHDSDSHRPADPRPLVVIDPEDREQVERLWDSIMGRTGLDDLATALREFANPKPAKPDEPQGLGAVVEDGHGCRWVLYTNPDNTAPWCDGSTSCEWDEVDAVRVLSEGVSA